MTDFAEMRDEFMRRIERIVWCAVATIDRKGNPRSRILHPIWEVVDGSLIGHIATGRHSFKEKHIAANPYVSLSYWDAKQEPVYVDAKAMWLDAPEERQRIWDMYKSAAPPLGYDPGMIWQGGPLADDFGVLRLEPWRVELWSLDAIANREPAQVWRSPHP